MKYFPLAILCFSCTATAFAQTPGQISGLGYYYNQNVLVGGLGITWIDDQPFYLINLRPELAFGKFGVGLDFNLRIGQDGKVRHEDYKDAYDYFRIIRYIRWGLKHDPLYIRAGALDYARLGHGSIMYLYRNSPSYEDRKIGLEFDVNSEHAGFESVYSDLGRLSVVGVRGYVRPLQWTTLASIPILGNLETGATFAGDSHPDAGVIHVTYDSTHRIISKDDRGPMKIVGADIGLPILRTSLLNLDLYADYAKILDFGSGTALGAEVRMHGLGEIRVSARIERRFLGDRYIHSYFDMFYELERYNARYPAFTSKVAWLDTVPSGHGTYGELAIDLLGMVQIFGGYQKIDERPHSGILHVGASVPRLIPHYILIAGYDRTGIDGMSDLFALDNRSLFYLEVGYQPMSFLVISLMYMWTYVPVTDAAGNVSYEVQKRVEPRVSFVFPLGSR